MRVECVCAFDRFVVLSFDLNEFSAVSVCRRTFPGSYRNEIGHDCEGYVEEEHRNWYRNDAVDSRYY